MFFFNSILYNVSRYCIKYRLETKHTYTYKWSTLFKYLRYERKGVPSGILPYLGVHAYIQARSPVSRFFFFQLFPLMPDMTGRLTEKKYVPVIVIYFLGLRMGLLIVGISRFQCKVKLVIYHGSFISSKIFWLKSLLFTYIGLFWLTYTSVKHKYKLA